MMVNYSDEFLAYLELSQDLLFDKIPKDKIPYYITESLAIGEEYALAFQGLDLRQVYQKENIAIERPDNDGDFFKVKLRAQFEFNKEGQHKIILYQKSIEELADICEISLQQAENILLAHEFFHYLELTSTEVSAQLAEVELFTFWNYTRKAHIARTSEIAAHSFAKKLLKLEKLPNYYDYCYLLKTEQLKEADLASDQNNYLSLIN